MPQNNINQIKKYNLASLSVFDGFSESEIETVFSDLDMVIKEYDENETIVEEYDKVVIGIIISGSAHIERTDWNGNRHIFFEISGNTVFGESLFFTNADVFRLAIKAKEKTSVLFINPENLKNSSKALMFNLMKIIAENTLVFREKLDILSQRTTRLKLLMYLNVQARKKNSDSFYTSLNRQALADYLCVERTALSKVISKLQKEGIIISEKNYFKLRGTFKTPF